MRVPLHRALFLLPAEVGHNLAHFLMRHIDVARFVAPVPQIPLLKTNLAGIPLPHPIGLAAGFDKNGENIHALAKLGFSYIEIGTVTLRPQLGNPRPRLFRDHRTRSIINRFGFNNIGASAVAQNLKNALPYPVPVGVNIGPNKDSKDVIADLCSCWQILAPLADFVTLNISSPNTPGLRSWHRPKELERCIAKITAFRQYVKKRVPLFVKLSPDRLTVHDPKRYEIFARYGIDGVILSNSTKWRPKSMNARLRGEKGGLSGRPLTARTIKHVCSFAQINTHGLEVIACGGLDQAEDVNEVLDQGAKAVQLYSGLIFQGMNLVPDLVARLHHIPENVKSNLKMLTL